MKRLGLFGGTFNPIHLGHLRAAEEAREAFGLDKVLFIPCCFPPHKKNAFIAPARNRLEMAALSTAGRPELGVSDFEASRQSPSFTIETLRHFQALHTEAERYFILGMDAFLEIHTWEEFPAHFALSHFVVLSRPGGGGREELSAYIASYLKEIFHYSEQGYVTSQGTRLFYFTCTGLDISGSKIRAAVQSGKSIRFLVCDKVLEHIEQSRLYR